MRAGNLLERLSQKRQIKEALEALRPERKGADFPRLNLYGLPDQAKPLIAAALALALDQKKPAVLLVPDELAARNYSAVLSELVEKAPLNILPLPLDLTAAEARSREGELELLAQIAELPDLNYSAVIVTADALADDLPAPESIRQKSLKLKLGEDWASELLNAELTELAYERVEEVDAAGQYAQRGDVIDIAVATESGNYKIYRLSLFDTEIDSLRLVDIDSQRSLENLKEITIPPARVLLLTEAERSLLIEQIPQELKAYQSEVLKGGGQPKHYARLQEQAFHDVERLKTGAYFPGLARWQYLLKRPQYNILDFCKELKLPLFIDEPKRLFRRLDAQAAEWQNELASGVEHGRLLPAAEALRPSRKSLGRQINAYSEAACMISLSQLGGSSGLPAASSMNLAIRDSDSYVRQQQEMFAALQTAHESGYRLSLFAGSEKAKLELEKAAQEAKLEVDISPAKLSSGFTWPGAGELILGVKEIFGQAAKRSRRKQQVPGRPIEFFSDLAEGDLVVHEDHGIGRFLGLETLSTSTGRKDYITIAYADDDRLFLPLEALSKIQKYLGAEQKEPKLTRLGGAEWQRQKSRARESIKQLAFDLVQLYAKRRQAKGHKFAPDSDFERDFEAAFPYTETPDQLRAMAEIKADMESERVMDRLLCGDVGFGKTELAFRALFKAVVDGRQAAFLAPTTVLAQQHFEKLKERLGEIPIRLALLSRFVPLARRREILKELERGELDLVVGTHRLLSKDVKFDRLGLLVIDEEQRFGVGHKEQLKEQYPDIDVLSLSATPIPRTLHMSLAGIRDISVLESGPDDRRPVITYVLEYEQDLLEEAILREIGRGGQVFYLLNNIKAVQKKAQELSELMPGLRVRYAHGQMAERQLEEVIMAFVQHEFDLLVCTTIIENGIDLPNVNTMIVENADRLGLAQLYQIRGRVGRSGRQAYAYITYRPDKVLTENAEKRLAVIRDYTELGSGFKIALRDLEVRGAGNLLGGEQHGHLAAIGYELYCRMLDDEIKNVMGESTESKEEFDPQIEFKLDALIPENYIRDSVQRMAIYRRIMKLASTADLLDLYDELLDRFGEPPEAVLTLLDLAYLRQQAIEYRIAEIKRLPDELRLIFRNDSSLPMAKISALLATKEAEYRLFFSAAARPQLTYRREFNTDKAALKALKELFAAADKLS
ncbi:MAG: transcription-repair coupling factor [Eubacteriales bacterium]|nr:transcription-repair coupling factor [Eubacteriales bacterium]